MDDNTRKVDNAALEDLQRDSPIKAYIANAEEYEDGNLIGIWQPLPTTKDEFSRTLDAIGVKNGEYIADDFETTIPGLENQLSVSFDIDELNYLAVKLAAMDGFALEKFGAALEYSVFRDGLTDIINTAENLDCFDLQPAFSEAEYGEFLAEMSRDEHADALARLENINEEGICALPSYIERLEKYFDAEAYARDVVQKEGGRFTEHGYLTKAKALKEIYAGLTDIPAEYRISVPPEPRERPSVLDKLAAAKDAVARADAEKPPADRAAKSPDTEL